MFCTVKRGSGKANFEPSSNARSGEPYTGNHSRRRRHSFCIFEKRTGHGRSRRACVTQPAEAQLEAGLLTLGIPHPAAACAKLIVFGQMLLEENKHTNLTGARTIHDLIREHFLDSLAPLRF